MTFYIETFKSNRCGCGDNVIQLLKSINICESTANNNQTTNKLIDN